MIDENLMSSMIPTTAEIEARIAWHQDELKWARRLLRLARKREAEMPGPLLALIERRADEAANETEATKLARDSGAGTDGGEVTP